MAHFARLGLDNIVEEVVVVNNVDTMTPQGVETESIGIDYLKKFFGQGTTWVQTSYSGSIRKNFAGKGYVYNSTLDAFIPPKNNSTWILDETTCQWIPPIPYPNDGNSYNWSEENQEWYLV